MISLLFSCEHATCAVPEAHRELFRGSEEIVTSPEGWDPGALNLAQGFSIKFRTPLVHGDMTRLLIDLDQNGDDRWSRFSSKLPEATRGKLIERHEKTYRNLLRQRISEDLSRHSALVHLMIHTTDGNEGVILLSSLSGNPLSGRFASAWSQRMRGAGLDVRHESASKLSCLAADLADHYPADDYAPIRLEVSQSFFLQGKPWRWETLKKSVIISLKETAEDSSIIPVRADSSPD